MARPSPVHEADATAMTSRSGGQAPAGMWTSSTSRPKSTPTSATAQPFTITGIARPRNKGIRAAGVVRTTLRVRPSRSPSMVALMANRHGMAA